MIKTLRQRCLRTIRHPAAILLWPILVTYMLTAKGHVEISDTDYSLRTARALVENGTLLIDPPDPEVGASAPVLIDGKMYSKYGVGLVFILLPLVLLGKALAFLPGITENLATGFLISFYNIPFALGTLWLLYETCRRLDLTENRARLVVYATAIGTMFWKYTVTDYSQVTQGFFLMGTVHFLLRGRAGDTYRASAFFAGLIVMKLVNVVLWAPCLLYLLILHRRDGREFMVQAMRFASIVFVAGLALAAVQLPSLWRPPAERLLFGAKQIHAGVSTQGYCGFAINSPARAVHLQPHSTCSDPGLVRILPQEDARGPTAAGHIRPLVPLHGLMDELPGRMGLGQPVAHTDRPADHGAAGLSRPASSLA